MQSEVLIGTHLNKVPYDHLDTFTNSLEFAKNNYYRYSRRKTAYLIISLTLIGLGIGVALFLIITQTDLVNNPSIAKNIKFIASASCFSFALVFLGLYKRGEINCDKYLAIIESEKALLMKLTLIDRNRGDILFTQEAIQYIHEYEAAIKELKVVANKEKKMQPIKKRTSIY